MNSPTPYIYLPQQHSLTWRGEILTQSHDAPRKPRALSHPDRTFSHAESRLSNSSSLLPCLGEGFCHRSMLAAAGCEEWEVIDVQLNPPLTNVRHTHATPRPELPGRVTRSRSGKGFTHQSMLAAAGSGRSWRIARSSSSIFSNISLEQTAKKTIWKRKGN